MAKKKKFKISFFGEKSGKKISDSHISLFRVLKAAAIVFVIAGIGVGFVFLDRAIIFDKHAVLTLINPPSWATQELEAKIFKAAKASGEDLKIDEDLAANVYRNLTNNVAWLSDIKVRVHNDKLWIIADWRKPVAMIKIANGKIYVDKDLIVLDYVPIPTLGIVEVTGLASLKAPPDGQVFRGDDLAAAVSILTKLSMMDEKVTPEKPLLLNIAKIDVTNFNGRKKASAPHIKLYTTNDTEIIWGAEFGTWQRYAEATDEQKLANLYGYYKEFGTFKDAKYINLRQPQDRLHKPVDNY